MSALDSTPAFVRDLAIGVASKYDVTVLAPIVPGAARREQCGPLDVRRFRYFFRRWEDLADGAILENVRTRRSRWIQVAPFVLAEALALRRTVRALRPDVVHIFWVLPQGVAALLSVRKLPWLVTTLGGDIYAARSGFSQWLVRAVFKHTQAVTTMNADMRRRIGELGIAPDLVTVLPMGVELEQIQRHAAGVKRMPQRILFVGRLVEKKGVAVLLDAVKRLPSGTYHVRVVGDGPLAGRLQAAAQGMPVEFLGGLSREALAREYAAASLVVFPSVSATTGDQDGLPVALLEAMAAGAAVVASALPGIDKVVTDGVDGRLVPPGQAQALGDVLAELIADSQGCHRLGEAARERAAAFSTPEIARRFVALLDWLRSGASPETMPQVSFHELG